MSSSFFMRGLTPTGMSQETRLAALKFAHQERIGQRDFSHNLVVFLSP